MPQRLQKILILMLCWLMPSLALAQKKFQYDRLPIVEGQRTSQVTNLIKIKGGSTYKLLNSHLLDIGVEGTIPFADFTKVAKTSPADWTLELYTLEPEVLDYSTGYRGPKDKYDRYFGHVLQVSCVAGLACRVRDRSGEVILNFRFSSPQDKKMTYINYDHSKEDPIRGADLSEAMPFRSPEQAMAFRDKYRHEIELIIRSYTYGSYRRALVSILDDLFGTFAWTKPYYIAIEEKRRASYPNEGALQDEALSLYRQYFYADSVAISTMPMRQKARELADKFASLDTSEQNRPYRLFASTHAALCYTIAGAFAEAKKYAKISSDSERATFNPYIAQTLVYVYRLEILRHLLASRVYADELLELREPKLNIFLAD